MTLVRLCFIVIAFSVSCARADHSPTTNAQQLDRLIRQALERIPESAFGAGNALQIIRPTRQDGLGSLFDQRLGEWALQRKAKPIRFFASEPESEIVGSLLHARILDAAVHYRPLESKNKVQRTVGLSMQFSVFDDGKQLLWAESIRDSLVDELQVGQIALVEDPFIPVTVGNKPTISKRKKWIEPFIVSTVSAIVIYLFYSYRSR